MGLFRAGTWHLSGGEKQEGLPSDLSKNCSGSTHYTMILKKSYKIKYILTRFYKNFLKSLHSAYCWDNFYVNNFINMHGGNNNMKFTNDRSLDRQLNEVLPRHVQVRMPPCYLLETIPVFTQLI